MTDTLTLEISAETRAKLERLGDATNRAATEIAEEALSSFIDQELSIVTIIEDGLADARNGNLLEHEEVVRRLRAAMEKTSRRA